MSFEEIAAVGAEVRRVTAPDAHLWLWVTNRFLPQGLWVMRSWGFDYRNLVTWMKAGKPGLGQYLRGLTEHCLFGIRGMLPYRADDDGRRLQGVTGVFEERGDHSEKPEAVARMIERVSHGPFLELFARAKRPGWTCWGDDVGSQRDVQGTLL